MVSDDHNKRVVDWRNCVVNYHLKSHHSEAHFASHRDMVFLICYNLTRCLTINCGVSKYPFAILYSNILL